MTSKLIAGAFPKRITLELTNRCNISCTFCPRHNMGQNLGSMDTELACRAIDEMANHLPVTLVPFFRGESLLHPEWDSIIAYARKAGVVPIQFTTNGTLLDEENAKKLLRCGVDFISFSLDTTDPVLYESTRRGASYEKSINNILRFIELHEQQKSPMTIQVSAVATKEHKAGMKDFVNFWRPRVDRVRVYEEHSSDGSPGSLQYSQGFPNRLPCKKVFEDLVILWNGDIAICNHDWQRQRLHKVFANIHSSSIADIWQGVAYQQLRRAHAENLLEDCPPCTDCEHWQSFYMIDQVIGELYTKEDVE